MKTYCVWYQGDGENGAFGFVGRDGWRGWFFDHADPAGSLSLDETDATRRPIARSTAERIVRRVAARRA